MELSKAYDCFNHDLIIAKLEAHGVGENNLRLIQNYISQRQQWVKVASFCNESFEIIFGVPQGSILGLIIFNAFVYDLLFFIKERDICNSTDDATLYACGKELDTISFKLEIETSTAIEWLKDNEMIANLSKFQLMFLSKTLKTTCLLIKKPSESSDTVELLGIALGKNIDLTRHMQNICHKENN